MTGSIRSRLQAGQSDWLAEMRRVTVLFVHLPGFDDHDPARAHEAIAALQQAIYHHEGSLNKLSLDDKGITLVAAFGLPPLAHEDDAARGVLAALAMASALRSRGEAVAIGVATGRVYCGEVGGARRREYTMIGDVVNLSARLMQAATAEANILCDEATARAAGSRLDFQPLPPITVKGKAVPVSPYQPGGRSGPGAPHRALFGRLAEREALQAALGSARSGRGGVIALEGEPGLGKSSLVAELIAEARAAGLDPLVGRTDPIEANTPYFAWRPILSGLLGLDDLDDLASRRQATLSRLAADPSLPGRAPLLNDILPLGFPDNELTSTLAGQVRADNLRDTLLRLIALAAAGPSLVIVLEDTHWLDSTSWALARALVDQLGPTLLVATSRPTEDGRPPVSDLLVGGSESPALLRLEPLPAADILELARDRLGVAAIPGPVASLIRERAEGRPLFAEELALALRDSDILIVEGGTCRVRDGIDLAAVRLPDTMHGAILGRIDRLAPAQQMTLKSASVIGRFFRAGVLRDIYPIATDRPALDANLLHLLRLGFTIEDAETVDDGQAFKHSITQEAAYALMLASQKRALHREVASWYEREGGPDLSPHFPLLAYHFEQAGEPDRAADYLVRAGERALRGGSYKEAIDFLTRALGLDGPGPSPRRARCEQLLAEGLLAIGDLPGSRAHNEHALAHLGRPLPRSKAGQAAGVLGHVLLQAARRLRGGARPSRDAAAAERSLRVAESDALAGQLSYFDQDLLLGLHSAVRGLNLAERARPSATLARAYATAAVAASLVPLPRVARHYAGRALAVAAGLDDLQARAWVSELAGMIELDSGRWDDGRKHLAEAVEIAERISDWRRWSEAAGELARLELHRGEFGPSGARFASQHDRAERLGHEQARIWGLHGQALNRLRVGDHPGAADLLSRSPAAQSADAFGLSDAILGGGLLAVALLGSGDAAGSFRAASATARRARSAPAMVGYSLDGYAGAAEALLDLARAGHPGAAAEARIALAALRSFARVCAIARPRALLLTARSHWLHGRKRRAYSAWRSALQRAESLSMPFEIGLAHADLGAHLPLTHDRASDHRRRAEAILEPIGATHILARRRD